jgi:ATP-dependent helicase HrpB
MSSFEQDLGALPIAGVLAQILGHLDTLPNLVLQAPPGAGKTTGVPLALLDRPWRGDGRIIVLEPRRLAARAAARWMAAILGESVGETCGYRVRLDSRIGPRTRIEVVTDGAFTRMIQDDPSLDGIAAVLFDEFHERRLETDLGLALCLDVQAVLRPDLRLLVMSATLDAAPVSALMGGCPIVTAEGRSHPIAIKHLPAPQPDRFGSGVADAVATALAAGPGDVLVFLPGGGEIRQVQRALGARDLPERVAVFPLHGELDPKAQELALAPAPAGGRKVVLATAIAETSLTIPGIRHVVDAGLARAGRYDPGTGMTRLETTRVTQAAATQRAGRAGRTAPGTCWRLWPEAQHRALDAFTAPEIAHADLAPLLLEVAQWGAADPAALPLLDQPNPAALTSARTLLISLDALSEDGQLTPHGRRMARLGTHPRLAHMLLTAADQGHASLAAAIAAILGERLNVPGGRDIDLRVQLELVANPRGIEAARRAQETARRLVRLLGRKWSEITPAAAGAVLALAYPDRLAERRGGPGRFRLAGGRGAFLPETDPLAGEPYLAIGELDGQVPHARIWLAAPISQSELERVLAARVETLEEIVWDDQTQSVQARRRRVAGALVLQEQRLERPPPEAVVAALIGGIRRLGLTCLPWSDEATGLRRRIAFVAALPGERESWPVVDDEALLADLENWLAPALKQERSIADLRALDLAAILRDRLDWEQRRRLDALAPTHIAVPSGSRIAVDYQPDGPPVLAVKLQEMFGLPQTPTVAQGQVRVQLHLLSPARRPIQVTSDLAGFWAGSYRAVRADLRGRYPRHPWPEDPINAVATARAKPRGS